MFRLLTTIVKITIASLVTGVILAKLNLSAEQLLLELGLTPERVITMLESGAKWVIPNIILGSLVVVPVWLVIYLFRPPRS
ncbi:MAG: DUF6460 domain-containing protein [Pseudomonadota bacterium]